LAQDWFPLAFAAPFRLMTPERPDRARPTPVTDSADRPPIRAVLFDKDGTLFDFARTWAGVARGALAALAPDDAGLRRRLGLAIGFDPDTGAFAPGSPVVAGATDEVGRALAALAPGLDAGEIARRIDAAARAVEAGDLAPAADDLPGLLDGLRARGLALGVATHDGEEAARRHLAAGGALDRFDFVAGYDSGHGLKPGPGMAYAFAAATGLPTSAMAMVGDSVHDLGVKRSAGMALAVGVLTGPATEADLAPHADVVIPSIAALPAVLWGDRR
jgi:phosphoglycolate phosphatase